MARPGKVYVGVEIGTSKTCVVVGEVKPDTGVRILSIGVTKSAGIRKGELADFVQARACLRDALTRAENASNTEIRAVYLAVTGAHIRGINSKGVLRLPENQQTILPEHVKEVSEIAEDIQYPEDHVCLHSIPRNYVVDGLELSSSPVGLFGKTIEANFHIVHGMGNRIQNSIKLVRECPLEVKEVVFSPIATAQGVLEREERLRGALLIDIGGGTTDFVMYLDGAIAACGCIPVGGDHVTNDIHLCTGLTFSKAEKLKILEGSASADPSKSVGVAKLADENGFADVEVKRATLNLIIRQRLEETLCLVRDSLPKGSVEALGAGIFLTGGASLTNGLYSLAFEVFGRDVYSSKPCESADLSHPSYEEPQFAAAIGLIRYAQILETENRKPPGLIGRLVGMFWPFRE